MTDARLHSTKPIDDEVPFTDAIDVPGEDEPADEDALVTPAAAVRERTMPDRDVEQSGHQTEDFAGDQRDA